MILNRRRDTGSALIAALAVAVILAGFAASMVTVVSSANRESTHMRSHLERFYLAEAGLNQAVMALRTGGNGVMGTQANPIPFGNGAFYVESVDNGNGEFTVTAHGVYGDRERALQVIVRRTGGVFASAIFAGNSSGDPNYAMEFGGNGGQADQIGGDLYSGGNIDVSGAAQIQGTARAAGTISGMLGDEGITQPLPDIAGADYANNNDYDVAAEFAAGGLYRSNPHGGRAWELPEANPSHIFRKNPDDRIAETSGTAKDDYFLEDPYEAATDVSHLTLSGTAGDPGPNSSDKVFFIDGNLWIHNKPVTSFQWDHNEADGIQVTFIVKGNLYISDDFWYEDKDHDGVVFITIEDENVADSGNIYFGDPRFGTLDSMHGFMYAENNFYDQNLSANGSSNIELYGIMSAGNHVEIDRNNPDGSHTQLVLDYDDRIFANTLDMPGLPQQNGQFQYTVLAWRETTPDE